MICISRATKIRSILFLNNQVNQFVCYFTFWSINIKCAVAAKSED